MEVFEYHNNILGIQARFIFEGVHAASETLGLIKARGLQTRIANGDIKKIRNNAPGIHVLLEFASLSLGWQRLAVERFGTPPAKVNVTLFEKFYERDIEAMAFFTQYMLKDGKFLPNPNIEEYTINASVLNTCFKVYDKRYALRKQMNGGVLDVWETIAKEAQLFRAVQPHTLPDHFRRLREKCMKYKKSKYDVLIHKNFANKNALRVSGDTMLLLNNMFATQIQKPTATDIARQYKAFLAGYIEIINNNTGELYNPKEFGQLSIGTITAWLAKWTNKVATHAKRSGDRQVYMGKFTPYHSMEQPTYSNSIISIDDRQPPFAYAPQTRMWFYNAVDLGSEAFTCSVYGKSKEGIIIDFYRQLVRNYAYWGINMPAELEAESSLNSSFKDSFLREGGMFQYVRIEANKARSKRIEGYNGQLRYELEKNRPGWIARPKALSESNQKGSFDVPLVPYEDIVSGCLQDIETWNNMPHSKIKGKTRWEVFMENQNPNVMPTNWNAILKSPLGFYTRTSCRTGIVKLDRKEFLLGLDGKIAYSDKLIGLLEQVEGCELDIYWLDDHQGNVLKAHIYLPNSDRFICELIAKPKSHRATIEATPESIEARTAMSKYEASVNGFMSAQKKRIEPITILGSEVKTLNTKFSMHDMMGIGKPRVNITVSDDNSEEAEPEILHYPEYDEVKENEKLMNTNWNKDLRDRF